MVNTRLFISYAIALAYIRTYSSRLQRRI